MGKLKETSGLKVSDIDQDIYAITVHSHFCTQTYLTIAWMYFINHNIVKWWRKCWVQQSIMNPYLYTKFNDIFMHSICRALVTNYTCPFQNSERYMEKLKFKSKSNLPHNWGNGRNLLAIYIIAYYSGVCVKWRAPITLSFINSKSRSMCSETKGSTDWTFR